MNKREKRIRRHRKIRLNMRGTKDRPRLFVFRSNKHIYAQLIDDDKDEIIMSVSDADLKLKKAEKKLYVAKEVGKLLAKKVLNSPAGGRKIEKVVFDRGGFIFHGRIKALADGAREEGLNF